MGFAAVALQVFRFDLVLHIPKFDLFGEFSDQFELSLEEQQVSVFCFIF